MPRMNNKGPENNGPKDGRKLGYCINEQKKDLSVLGKGLAKRRKEGGGEGLGKRLKYNELNFK